MSKDKDGWEGMSKDKDGWEGMSRDKDGWEGMSKDKVKLKVVWKGTLSTPELNS